ncbi:hypothetical protein HAX54_029683 [Datura stramonium]|uniref:Uncharacterized protein n=1 Tax=Datura stramonium TaxID=4076 RepID=A0ABS8V7T7_DATST|nr:hypothetical protein [Datura stramonium]
MPLKLNPYEIQNKSTGIEYVVHKITVKGGIRRSGQEEVLKQNMVTNDIAEIDGGRRRRTVVYQIRAEESIGDDEKGDGGSLRQIAAAKWWKGD